MAARQVGSGGNNLVFFGAKRLRDGFTLLSRDCAINTATPDTVGTSQGISGTISHSVGSGGILTNLTSGVFVSTYEAQGCQRNAQVHSFVQSTAKTTFTSNIRLGTQPFVITGDTILTEKDLGGGAMAVTVERLGGNERNVFSLDSLKQDLPAEPKLLVPEKEGLFFDDTRLLIPYSYQTTRIVATTSRNYVFYASNPSLDVFGAYFKYCSRNKTSDDIPQFGLLLKSSYGPIRVYRVSAYRRCATYSCGSNLVRFRTIPGFVEDFSQKCNQTFNVGVVGLEYLNEDNIAVRLQVSRVDQWNDETGTWKGDGTFFKTVWLHPSTMNIQDTIWQTSIATSNYGALCPGMQRLPRVGTFLAEMINAGVFLVRMVTFGVVYTPGMVQIWSAGGQCPSVPLGSYYHEVLGDCGSGMYALDDFFDSLDDASAVFWHGLTLLGELLVVQGDTIPQSNFVSNVLDGMAKYGEGTIDIWAARSVVLTITKLPVKDQLEGLWGIVEGGAGSMSGVATGASKVQSGMVAWSRFTYKVVLEVALMTLKLVLKREAVTSVEIWQNTWGILYELRGYFTSTITSKNRMACAGLKLMFGMDNPWASVVYHQCMANAELMESMMKLGLTLFVDIPMVKCVCKSSSGALLSNYVTTVCSPRLPVSLRPTLYMIANQYRNSLGRDYQSLACASVLDFTRNELNSSFDPWFSNQFSTMEALSSSVDYMTIPFDTHAGQCLDFQHDSHVVVIVPEPIDYFLQCGKTSLCKSKCKSEWDAFQKSNTQARALDTISISVESLFFPGELDRDLMLTNVTAVIELTPEGLCVARKSQDIADYALGLAEYNGQIIQVQYWCVPQMTSATVYKVQNQGFESSALPGDLMTVAFGNSEGTWLAMMLRVDASNEIYWMSSDGILQSVDPLESHIPAGYYLVRVTNMWVIEECVVLDLVLRHFEGTDYPVSTAEMAHVFMRPLSLNTTTIWRPTNVDLSEFGGQYWYTRLQDGTYYFFPQLAAHGVFRGKFQVDSQTFSMSSMTYMQEMDPLSFIGSMHSKVMSSRSLSSAYVFVTSVTGWDWLQQMRLGNGFVEGVFNSVPTTATLNTQGNCNEKSCEGCKDITAHRLCMAYNKCALMKCVGTPVNQMRPLCGLGQMMRKSGNLGLRATQGAFRLFVEMIALTLELTMTRIDNVRLLWPEDGFMCYICTAKDASAEFFSVLTATINSLMQLGNPDLAFMYGSASNVDTNADAMLTISATALNGFMHQANLMPLYGMVVSHQIMMCKLTGVIALLDNTGFVLSIQPAGQTQASDLIAGQCLTKGAETMANYPQDNPASLGYAVSEMVQNSFHLLLIQQIEPALHVFDATLAYWIGVVHTFGVFVMSQSMAQCNPPDSHLKEIVECACDDTRLSIPNDVDPFALWCTGTLSMVDSSGHEYFVYNPFTYQELRQMSSGLQTYVNCMTDGVSGYSCAPPTHPEFDKQGVSLLNVLVKCRENYVKRRWDPGAYVWFDSKYHQYLKLDYSIFPPFSDACQIKECIVQAAEDGTSNMGCLQQYQLCQGLSDSQYWSYERSSVSAPEYTDACLVFSGPSSRNWSLFQQCVDGPDVGNCSLPVHCWSPSSSNSVPVCEQHMMRYHGINHDGLVQRLYQNARDMVLSAIDETTRKWASDDPAVNVDIFSVEGDIIHQTMDCIFMGPYARVDYWPMPFCQDGEECIEGPYWSRDLHGGQTRSVDPESCPSSTSLPYTCGSMGRRALIRFFVRDLLSSGGSATRNANSSLIQTIIRETMTHLRANWSDTETYGCMCDTGLFSPLCCTLNTTKLLPDHLNQAFDVLNTSTVMMAMDDYFREVYDWALENRGTWLAPMYELDPQESDKYDWRQSQRAKDEARFNPVSPVFEYSKNETMYALGTDDQTLWGTCHAALKQVFFTMPVNEDGLVYDPISAFDGNSQKIEDYIRNFTQEAFQKSPLYRHYYPRHAPSHSQMCAGFREDTGPPQKGSVEYDTLKIGVGLSIPGNTITPISADKYTDFMIGAINCACGWKLLPGDMCSIPVGLTCNRLCSLLDCDIECGYHISKDISVRANLETEWECPMTDFSAHWGFMDSNAAESWLQGNVTLRTSMYDLLENGRAGIRIGNIHGLLSQGRKQVNPNERKVPIEHGQVRGCYTEDFLRNTSNFADVFVEELFPMAQGVEEAGAVAYCLRYVLETSRLHVFEIISRGSLEHVRQRELTKKWERKCGAQMQLIHLCVKLSVYHPQAISTIPNKECKHFRAVIPSSMYPSAYSTPECLLSVSGVFYDPCRCIPCLGDSNHVLDISKILRDSRCLIRFDPRRMLEEAPVGWWPRDESQEEQEFNAFSLDPRNLLRNDFTESALRDPDVAGNTDTENAWWESEGNMDHTSEFCDMIVDWWPDDWDFPVGYHVTTPCHLNETAYRSFSHVFGLHILDDGEPVLRYQNDLLRDVEFVDTNFGMGGLCRKTNFGMEMLETNTMRYCTSVPNTDVEDFTLPLGVIEAHDEVHEWMDMRCTSSSRDVPWPDSTVNTQTGYISALHSVGTVPNIPRVTSSSYPESSEQFWDVGPGQEVKHNAWGSGSKACSDFRQFRCTPTVGCLLGYVCRGKVCEFNHLQSCHTNSECGDSGECQGICMDSQTVDCIMHADCTDGVSMCSGTGKCVIPTIAVQNELLNDNVSFQLSVNGTCPPVVSREFSMLGASYWGYVSQDLLRVHGMCSYQDWYRYTNFTASLPCKTRDLSDYFEIDPSKCNFMDFQLPLQNQTKWWPEGQSKPDIFAMRPSNCDRDYERLEGFKQCAPISGRASFIGGSSADTHLEFDQYYKVHAGSNKLLLAKLPYMNNQNFGFLGLNISSTFSYNDMINEFPFVSCGTLSNCYPSPFTVKGVLVDRTISTALDTRAPYDQETVFRCGAFGKLDNSRCVLDQDVLPLYRALCDPDTKIPECVRVVSGVTRLCSNIKYAYQANNIDRTGNLQGLRDLFYGFLDFVDLEGYLKVTQCMDLLYLDISLKSLTSPRVFSPGLYFPFMFVLYEFPFDWFYQCMVMNAYTVDVYNRQNQDCVAFRDRAMYRIRNYGGVSTNGLDDPLTYLRFVRGGYLPWHRDSYESASKMAVQRNFQAALDTVKAIMYPQTEDRSRPVCSKNKLWQIGPYGDAVSAEDTYDAAKRAVIWNWYNATNSKCLDSWHDRLIQKVSAYGINKDNWKEKLTMDDPVNIIPQNIGSPTLLAKIKAFFLGQLNVKFVDYVVENGVSKPSRGSFGDFGCLYYPATMPDMYDMGNYPLETALYPTSQFSSFIEVRTMNDELVNKTCVFQIKDDPGLEQRGSSTCRQVEISVTPLRKDKITQCGNLNCSLVPIASARDGKFNCRYMVDGIVITESCTENTDNVVACVERIMQQIYTRVLQTYQPPGIYQLEAVELDWFTADNSWFARDGFKLMSVLDFEGNLQPDPDRAVMCEIRKSGQAMDYMSCQNDNYRAIQKHVQEHYIHDGSVIIPSKKQLEWQVTRSVFLQGAIFGYANKNRMVNHTFFKALFDDDTVCKVAPVGNQRVCWKQENEVGKFIPVNPWLMGRWNPYSSCDVSYLDQNQGGSEFIDSACSPDNPACETFNQRLIPAACSIMNGMLVPTPGVPRLVDTEPLEYNLCHHQLLEDAEGCLHDQGLLGNNDGLPVAAPGNSISMIANSKYENSVYEVAPNMYENSKWEIPEDLQGGLFSGTNDLWAGLEMPYGFLKIHEYEIGVHRIGISISRNATDTISSFLITRLSLHTQDNNKLLNSDAVSSSHVKTWVKGLKQAMNNNHIENQRLYQIQISPTDVGPSCPLQRVAFYAGNYNQFSPTIPSPRRAQHAFWRVNDFLLAHPTMTQDTTGIYLGDYKTSNGFCFCPLVDGVKQSQCLASLTRGQCSLAETINALKASDDPSVFFESRVYTPLNDKKSKTRCEMHLDWPNVNHTLRDGTTFTGDWSKASDPSHLKCHVLDRFRPFRYRYRNSVVFKSSPWNTVQKGVCQTRRVATLGSATPVMRCVKFQTFPDLVNIQCKGMPALQSLNVRVKKTASEMHERMRAGPRQRCKECTRPPRFQTEQGRDMPIPESSFGRPFRLSAERMLAKDLRDALCNPDCPAFNQTGWERGNFMENYMLYPSRLFLTGSTGDIVNSRTSSGDDSSQWHKRGWVYCPSGTALKSGRDCVGTMSRDSWIKDKTTLCPRMIRSLTRNGTSKSHDPMARTPFCNLDNTTERVCSAINEARKIIQQANCIASGDPTCMPSPFMYSPAIFDTSNKAWVHDTVGSFYRHIEAESCPLSTDAATLYQYNRKYMQSCPANAITIFEGILKILRVLVTRIALIISTILSMIIKLFAMLFTSERNNMRDTILRDWDWLKKEILDLLYTLSDLFLDMLTNTGNLGALLMSFLERVCSGMNEAISWFLNVWCNYVKTYMVHVLAGLRKAMGIMGAGQEILQDFMDEVLQGILPASFIAKYAQGSQFQNLLAQKYNEPTEHKDKVKGGKNVKPKVNVVPASRMKRIRLASSRLAGQVARGVLNNPITRNAGILALGVGVAMGISEMMDESARAALYPENFTLFDLSDIVNVLDDMEQFLVEDTTCYVFQALQRRNASYNFFPCLKLDIQRYENTSRGTTALDATRCWADANPSLGQSSLFSCTGSSTCLCIGSTCSAQFVMCDMCPLSQIQGVNKFACNALQQKCMCGQVQTMYDRCSGNGQCGSSQQCIMKSALDSVSYGTIPCGNCPGIVMCGLPTSGLPGQCTCLTNDRTVQYDLCADSSGQVTTVSTEKMCGYLPGLSQTRNNWVFEFSDLIMLPCLQVKQAVCSVVYVTPETSIRMSVAITVRLTQTGRRLLADGEIVPDILPSVYSFESEYELVDSQALHDLLHAPYWNHTAAPCSTLVLAYQAKKKLGILDEHELYKCAYWRYVGRRTIQRYNLTALQSRETFLLSVDDFSSALMERDVLGTLTENPLVVLRICFYHPWMKPVRAVGVLLANYLEQVDWMHDVASDITDSLFGDINISQVDIKPRNRFKPTRHANGSAKPGRKLMSVQSDAEAVASYSVQILNGNKNPPLALQVAQSWGRGPFAWPPRYNYSLQACPLGLIMLEVSKEVFLVTKLYYANFDKQKPVQDRSFRAALPQFTWASSLPQKTTRITKSWTSFVVHTVTDMIGLDFGALSNFFLGNRPWTMQWIVQTATSCDLASAMSCNRHNRDLFMSILVFMLFYFIVSIFSQSIGFSVLSTLFWLSFPFFILWYTFGMAPSCFPMLPTCLLQDVIATTQELLPPTMDIPILLRCNETNSTCLKSCEELGFTSWGDPLAFLICDIHSGWCESISNASLVSQENQSIWQQAVSSVSLNTAKMQAIRSKYQGQLGAFRICMVVMWITTLPALCLLLAIVVVAGAISISIIAVIPAFFSLIAQTIAFHKAPT